MIISLVILLIRWLLLLVLVLGEDAGNKERGNDEGLHDYLERELNAQQKMKNCHEVS